MVLLQLPQRVAKLGMRRGDCGEQLVILALMVAGQGGTEAVAEQQQLARCRLIRLTVGQRSAGHSQGFA